MIIRVHKYLIGREARCVVVIDSGGSTYLLVYPSGRVGCSSEAYIDLWVERRFVNSGGPMIIYQRIFFWGGGSHGFQGGIEGVGRRQQSIRRVLWNIYCRLTTNEGGGMGGTRISQSFMGVGSVTLYQYTPLHTNVIRAANFLLTQIRRLSK